MRLQTMNGRALFRLHPITYSAIAVTAAGAFAYDIPSSLWSSRPPSTTWLDNAITTLVVTAVVAVYCQTLVRRIVMDRPFQFRLMTIIISVVLLSLFLFLNTLPNRCKDEEFRSYIEQRGEKEYEIWGENSRIRLAYASLPPFYL